MKVLAATSTRADWGLLVPVLDALRDDPQFDLSLAATGQHLTDDQTSLHEILSDGHNVNFKIDMQLTNDDSPEALAQGMGLAVAGTGQVLSQARPDLMLVLGDRYETLAIALAAVVARVPIAHLCGGDITEGAFDDAIRHSITKLSALHFPTNAQSAERIVQLGEEPSRVHAVGSTGIDRLLSVNKMDRNAFFSFAKLQPQSRNFVITFHPPTLSGDAAGQAIAMLDALNQFPDAGLVFTGSNADPGAREIDNAVMSYVERRKNAVFHPSLGSRGYLSALQHCDLVIGNSSSGIMEAPSFHVPTINIGDRQARRPRAASIIDCLPHTVDIQAAIKQGLAADCSNVRNPFGDGLAAQRIVNILASVNEPINLTRKSFLDR